MKILFGFVTCLIASFDVNGQSNDFQWLIGTWQVQGQNVFEVWKPHGAKELAGKSFKINGADTIVTETILLKVFNGSFHYIPDVAGSQPPIDFIVTSADSLGFVAENPQHDFPKVIRYRYVRKGSEEFIEAAIEGNGKVIPYSFR